MSHTLQGHGHRLRLCPVLEGVSRGCDLLSGASPPGVCMDARTCPGVWPGGTQQLCCSGLSLLKRVGPAACGRPSLWQLRRWVAGSIFKVEVEQSRTASPNTGEKDLEGRVNTK